MDLIRVNEKIISRHKIDDFITEILQLRSKGLSQTDVAARLGIDRTLVSRLENMGEVRKGKSVAVFGFPIANSAEISKMLHAEGVDFTLIMTEQERLNFIRHKSGLELFDAILELIALAHSFEQIVIIGSDQRIKIIRAALNKEVVGLVIGESPMTEDKYVNAEELAAIIRAIKAGRGGGELNE